MHVYHGSKVPIKGWDASKNISGYYPGFYTYPDKEKAKQHGHYVYELDVNPSEFYEMLKEDESLPEASKRLKKLAANNGYEWRNGSGWSEVQYLKSLGYKGMIRGQEYILFEPHNMTLVWSFGEWLEWVRKI